MQPQPSQAVPDTPGLPEVLKPFIVTLHGKPFVQYAGLLLLAHERGLVILKAHFISVTPDLALAEAEATFADGTTYGECADSTPQNVGPTIKAHFPRADHTVAELLDAYEAEYLPTRAPSTQYQTYHMFIFFRMEIGHLRLCDLTPELLRQWRDSLSERFAPGSVRRYMDMLSGPLTVAARDYEWIAVNPLRKVRKPPEPPGRVRCLTVEERQRLLEACKGSRNPHLYLLVLLALSTGARKNELLERRWQDVDLERGLLSIAKSKNGDKRSVPITGLALELLRHGARHRRQDTDWLFPRYDGLKPVEIHACWPYATRRAGLEDFHFHDLRHTAASYLAMSGASLLDIATVLGHKSLQMTKKYSHLMTPYTTDVAARMTAQFLGDVPLSEPPQGSPRWHVLSGLPETKE